MCETFRQITQKLWVTKTRDLYKFYNILSSWLLPLNGFQLNFLLHDSGNDLYLSFENETVESGQIFVTCPYADSAS